MPDARECQVEIESERRSMNKHIGSSGKSRRMAKANAYKIAKTCVNVVKHCFNEFIDRIRAQYRGSDPWTAYLNDVFAEFDAQLGEDHHALIADIENGLTLKQYLAGHAVGSTVTANKSKTHKQAADAAAQESTRVMEPEDEIPVKDQLAIFKQQNAALRKENKELRAALQSKERECIQKQRALEKAESAIRRAAKNMQIALPEDYGFVTQSPGSAG
jgi:hypothetical protein